MALIRYTTNLPYCFINSNYYRYIVSWGGDLQTAAKALYFSGNTNFTIYDVFSGNYTFDYCDLYADLDAVNIATDFDFLGSISLSSRIDLYYFNLTNNNIDRKTSFINCIASTINDPLITDNNMKFLVALCDVLKLSTNLQEKPWTVYDYAKYKLMLVNSYQSGSTPPYLLEYPSLIYRSTLATEFFYYITGLTS